MADVTLRVFRGDSETGAPVDYKLPLTRGMVVLDAMHSSRRIRLRILQCAGIAKPRKCGSCSAEVNGRPRLMCKTRMDSLPLDQPITVFPMKSFPLIKDLVTDVSWNYEVNKKIPPFQPRPGVEWKIDQKDVDRVQEFRKCIECFLCQNVCHVLRDHGKTEQFGGPRFFVRTAGLGDASSGRSRPHRDAEGRARASASATSRNAARKFARKRSTSPTTPSFR